MGVDAGSHVARPDVDFEELSRGAMEAAPLISVFSRCRPARSNLMAYSRIERSEENQPTLAVFRIDACHQSSGLRHCQRSAVA